MSMSYFRMRFHTVPRLTPSILAAFDLFPNDCFSALIKADFSEMFGSPALLA